MNGVPSIDDGAIVDAVLRVRPDTQAVYRFGSTVTGYARPDSDVDVAVLVGRPIDWDDRMALLAEVSKAAGRDADIMDLRHASTIAQFQVLSCGCLIGELDARASRRFNMSATKDYQDIKVGRRRLEMKLLTEGFGIA